jgi:hypothetical protein
MLASAAKEQVIDSAPLLFPKKAVIHRRVKGSISGRKLLHGTLR